MAGSKGTTVAKRAGSTLDRLRDEKSVGQLREMDFDDLVKMAEEAGELLDATQLGEGYHLLASDDKEKLVNAPFAVVDARFNEKGKYGGFVTLHIKTKFPIVFGEEAYQHFILNDGSTGIARQIRDMQENGFHGIIYCRHGLRVSKDYEVTEKKTDPDTGKEVRVPIVDPATGKPILGTTYYLDTSL
jgi:hypothetical protein